MLLLNKAFKVWIHLIVCTFWPNCLFPTFRGG